MARKKRFSPGLRVLLALSGMLSAAAAGFLVWGLTPAKPMPEVYSTVLGDAAAQADLGAWLSFVPDGGPPVTGFILYPGGHVDYRAYAPFAQSLADQGYLVVVPRMPLSLAVLNPDAALDVIAAHPEITAWALGGHSLGGAMAANFAYTHPGLVQGLVLWAAYPAGNNDLSTQSLPVLSISASLDGLSTTEKIDASRPLLPADTLWVEIVGGNHAQFGWYGDQPGDNPATLSRQEQQSQVVDATAQFLANIHQQ